MGLAARVVTRSGRARPVCDSGRGSRTGEPRGTRRTAPGSRLRLGATARGRGGCGRCQEPPRACAARDAEVWLAGAAGAAGSTGTGRGAGGCGALSRPRVVCGGPLGPATSLLVAPSRGGLALGKLSPRGAPAEIGGGGRGRGGGQALFVSFHFPRQPRRRGRGAGAERPGPRE